MRVWARALTVSGAVLDDGARVTAALDDLKYRFAKDVLDHHLKVVGQVRIHHEDYDPVLDQMRVVIEARTVPDPEWTASVLAEVSEAVAEDQQWFTGQGMDL